MSSAALADAARASPFVSVLDEGPLRVTVTLVFTELQATIAWSSPEAPRQLTLQGALPAAEGATLSFRPQRGLGGALEAIGEIELDDEAVDAAWVIRGNDAGLVLQLLPELRALATLAPAIVVEPAAVAVSYHELSLENAQRAVEGALAVWHRIAFFRLG